DPGALGGLRRTQDSRREGPRELLAFRLGVRPEGDPAEAAVGRTDEQVADWRLGQVVGGVEQAGCGGGAAEAGVELGGDGAHCVFLLRMRRTPADAAWRAAVSFEPSAAPMSS